MATPAYPNPISALDLTAEFAPAQTTNISTNLFYSGAPIGYVPSTTNGYPGRFSGATAVQIPTSGTISYDDLRNASKLPPYITVYAIIVGGGGGGGGGQDDAYGGGGGGGGGGGIRKLQLTAMNKAFAADIVIGQGGSAGQLYSPGGDGTNTVSPEGYSTGTSSLIEKKSTAPIWANGATPVPAGAPSGYNYNVYVGQTNAGFGYAGLGGFVGPSLFGNGGAGGQGGNAGGSRGSPGTSGGSDGVRAGGGGGGSDDTPSLGNGGNGVPWIDGAYYGGGGGGGGDYSLNSKGGLGGGGAGGAQNPGTAGTNGLGGGGGGGGSSNGRTPGGAGGSGCIIFAYTKAYGQLLTGGTVTSDANYYYHKITSPLETFVNNAIAWS